MELTLPGKPALDIIIDETTQVGQTRRLAQQLAGEAGFDESDSGRVALVATELATNVLKHGRGGNIYLRVIPGRNSRGVEIVAVDRGPGFHLADCLPDGFSTQGTQGIGLGAVVRQSQVMDVYSDHRGSVVLARLYGRPQADEDIRYGVSQTALHGEAFCGDSWALAVKDTAWSMMMVDGLGHGEAASVAAEAAVKAFGAHALGEPAAVLEEMHRSMMGTRGGAAAVARVDTAQSSLRFSGIGNISAYLVNAESARGLASHPGIVGSQFRHAQSFDFGDIIGKLLIMHSDGLQSRWRMADYPGLPHRHPAVIAAVLHRDFNRNRDDATVMVVALERTHV